ncbi:MAG: HlyC/CorC family transporter [Lachnospiraceae bacterium]|nr:HlyC/CorC family transporter [Lachnospiraceae bacterium]NBJ82002.1 HlyC/CorC family transporter [bacterium 1XD42-76]NBK04569.1 HlyC/CorC family transporter [bacterium 1XD42-94]
MDSGQALQIVVVMGLLALSSFFSSAETAMMTVNKIRVRTLAEAGLSRAKVLAKILDNQPKMLSAILIGNNIVNLSASSLMTVLVTRMLGDAYVGAATGVLTLLILIFGEITPKTTATLYPETVALWFARPIYAIMQVLTPVIFVVDKMSMGVLRLLHIDPNKKQDAITEDELRTIVEVSHEEGVIESDEKKMIYNVFDFGDSVAKDIMVPRIDMTFFDVDAAYDEVLEVFRKEKYTRYPVYEGTTDNVIGIINIKDLLFVEEEKDFKLRDYLREPLYTYEFKKTAELMVELRKTQNNIAIVLDEYGATAGLITLEDMLEEIVGEIRDEYDDDEEDLIRRIGPKELVVEAAMKIDDLNDQLGLTLESEDYDSLGGFVIGLLDHLPEEKEEVIYENLRFVVDKVERNRIDKIHMYILDEKEAEAAKGEGQ